MMKFGRTLVLGAVWILSLGGCTVSTSDDLDTDLDIDTESDTVEPIDTALDGIGGVDEACYVGVDDADEEVKWCDEDLIATLCEDNDVGCCCRASCEPSICPAVDSDEGVAYCLNLGLPDGFGVCSYEMDEQVVGYDCPESCVSRSECIAYDESTGECLDDPLPDPAMGICLAYPDIPEESYCMQLCLLAACDDLHTCEAVQRGGGTFDGTGICLPN